ncbi:hypothetical protein QQZ08_005421 [Neonectria magnoliae]|uniref:Caspase domain-containing protein n=1 Tax=Neonectria magnoliae TaxID=2732573 RepID=A0ABR1I3D4_9HYPO
MDCDYQPDIPPAALFSDGPANLDTFQVLTSIPGKGFGFTRDLITALNTPTGARIAIETIFAEPGQQNLEPSNHINLSQNTAADSIVLYRPDRNLDRRAIVPFHEDRQTICSYIKKYWSKDAPREVTGIQVRLIPDRQNPLGDLEITVNVVHFETIDSTDYLRWIRKLYLNTGTVSGDRALDLGQAIQDPQEVVQEWNSNGRSWTILPGPHDGRYGKVHVLRLKFRQPGLEESHTRLLENQIAEIGNVFLNCFDFDVPETFQIPQRNGQEALRTKLPSTIAELGSRDLLIVVYSGHGADPSNHDGDAIWA